MRNFYAKPPLGAFLAICALLFPALLHGQACVNSTASSPCTRSGVYYGEILPNNGCGNFTSVTPYSPGTYFRMPVLNGACYTISTCGSTIDTQISAFQGASTTSGSFAYVDDNGPDCSGNQSSIVLVPSFTDYATFDVRQYNCSPGGSASITVKVRQNNNLSITSSNADLCQGGVRALTATPVRVTVTPPSGGGDMGTFTGTGVSGTNFTAPTPAGATASYTITYTFGYCNTTQAINVFRNPTAANAGSNQTICSGTANISGNVPTVGSGVWSIVSGPGSITSPTTASTTVTGLVAGTPTVVRWTISNGPCTASTSQITLTREQLPTTSAAGPNQNVCSTSANMAANSPTVGTGQWSLVGGSGTIVTANNPVTVVNNLGVGPNTFIWAITNGGCPASTDTVVIIRDAAPTTALAGPNQSICDSVTNLAANAPSVGNGMWSIVSGAGTLGSMTNPNTTLSAVPIGSTVLTWTISNGSCPVSVDTIAVTRNAPPATPTITGNTTVCPGGSTVLTANSSATNPSYTWWNAASGGNSLASTTLYNTPALTTTTSFWVEVEDGTTGCTSGRAMVTITVNPLPNASLGPDTTICSSDTLCLNPGTFSGYLWSNGTSVSTNCVSNAGLVWVLVTDTNGCQDADSIVIGTRPSPVVNLGPNISYCEGSSANIGVTPGNGTYSWNTGASTSMITVNTPGTYTLTLTDTSGCAGTDAIVVSETPLPDAAFSTDASGCPVILFTDLSTDATSWNWSFGDGGASPNQNPSHNYLSAGNGTYNVQLIATSSCGSDTVVIPLVINCIGTGAAMPDRLNVTVYPNPNNGTFKVNFIGLEDDAAIKVFNMAGQLVYVRDLAGVRGDHEETVKLGDVAAGTYVVKLRVGIAELSKRIIVE